MDGKKTPLYGAHLAAGGKMVEFGGYCLPVQYETGVIREHMAVRTACGLFDVSHMGEILVEGEGAVAYLNRLLTNDYTVMRPGQARYSPMCREDGGTVDDLIVYKIRDDSYFVVVNAANKEKDFAWMKAHQTENASVSDVSDRYAQIALQGPKAEALLRRLTGELPEKYYTALFDARVDGIPCILSRTGYTGEDGFEMYLAPDRAEDLWTLLLQTGKEDGLIPCGLGARDTLRLEAAMPLYGHELSDTITPLEAGLRSFVKLEKPGFIGREALLAQAKKELYERLHPELIEKLLADMREELKAEIKQQTETITEYINGTVKPELQNLLTTEMDNRTDRMNEMLKLKFDELGKQLHNSLYEKLYFELFENLFNALYVPEPEEKDFMPQI